MTLPGQIFALALVVLAIWIVASALTGNKVGDPPRGVSTDGPRPRTITRQYRGSPGSATADFQQDAAVLEAQGYYPVSQIYSPGSYGCGAFLLALILFVILIGILIFIYMLIVKPAGTLVVAYEYRPPTVAPTAPAPAAADPAAALASLVAMRDQGLITPEEYEAKKADLLARI